MIERLLKQTEQRVREEIVEKVLNVKSIPLNGRNATIDYIINLLTKKE